MVLPSISVSTPPFVAKAVLSTTTLLAEPDILELTVAVVVAVATASSPPLEH